MYHFKGSVNPEIVKNTARCKFLIVTVMYIKVYISWIEMSQKNPFLISNFTKNGDFLRKITFWAKKSFVTN